MKILLVSFHFPPHAPAAATRIGKLAKFLVAGGHDVRVLAARQDDIENVHECEIPEELVVFTDWVDVRNIPEVIIKTVRKILPEILASSVKKDLVLAGENNGRRGQSDFRRQLLSATRKGYEALTCWPDNKIGWKLPALEAGSKLLAGWTPDLIYATAPPPTTLLVARELSRRHQIPWVCELRDLWTQNPYETRAPVRKLLEGFQERAVFRDAHHMVTVSPVWQQWYEAHLDREVSLVWNGFDEDEFPLAPPFEPKPGPPVNLLYAGSIYPGRRDPYTIFEAIAKLGDQGKNIHFRLFGEWMEDAKRRVAELGIETSVEFGGLVPHKDIIRYQYESDLLVLLQWDSTRDLPTVPGKLFEYMATRRPILATGYVHGITATLIRKMNLGLLSNDPDEIATYLEGLIAAKTGGEPIPSLEASVRDGFSRREQFEYLEERLIARL